MPKTCGTRKLISRKLGELTPFERNARTHSDSQIAQIAASIAEFGWTNPLLIDEAGGVIAGHGRLLAAKQLGPELSSEDKAEFQQMTFTVHDDQAEQVKAALDQAKAMGAFVDSPNENSNGNALARVCETFLTMASADA